MNTIGALPTIPVLPAAPKPSAPVSDSATVLPEASLPGGAQQTDSVELSLALQQQAAQSAESREPIANASVLGNTTFVTFKDATGQAVTRFRDVTTGKISYYPRDPEFTRVDIRA